jgi:hydrogenase nickel incorporation protein HypB
VSHLLLLNKIDLIGATGFRVSDFRANAARVNPTLPLIELSARTGEGVEAWVEWLLKEVAVTSGGR